MNFKIYLVGNSIHKFYREAIREYEKRLSRYCKIQLVSVKNNEQLSAKLPDKQYKITISTAGHLKSSEELAEEINLLGVSGKSEVAIIIGTEDIPSDELLALSPMEMEPGLQATIIFEQIYRAYRILNNQPYHK